VRNLFALPVRWSKALAVLLVGFSFLVSITAFAPSMAGTGSPAAKITKSVPAGGFLPLEQQPFYPKLEAKTALEKKSVLVANTGETPEETILDFYSMLSYLYHEIVDTYQTASQTNSWFWPKDVKEHFKVIDQELITASEAIYLNNVPPTSKFSTQTQSALKLKQILDYVFAHYSSPIELSGQKMGIWEIPQSPITLDRVHGLRSNYQFDETTLSSIPALFDVIRSWSSDDSTYYSPNFYTNFALTPGRLLAPKWYLMLPESVRNIADFSIDGENTALQILFAVGILFVYGVLIQFLGKRYLSNQKLSESASFTSRKSVSVAYVNSHVLANVFVALAAVGVSLYALHLIIHLSNLTGWLYRFITFILDISAFASASLFSFLALSVIGTFISRSYLKATGRLSDQDRNRIGGAILPVFRFLGVCLAIYFFYQLLLSLGLPASAIVAFSAVPGLAIGLGASKMLGNLFAGLSIQSDRPFQVGDFVEIGAAKPFTAGFISRIGIRSIELLTDSSSVNFPNSKVDEDCVRNLSFDLLTPGGERKRVTHIKLDTDLQLSHSPEDLLLLEQALKDHLDGYPSVIGYALSVKRSLAGLPAKVLCEVSAEVVDWNGYEIVRNGFADYLDDYEAAMAADPVT